MLSAVLLVVFVLVAIGFLTAQSARGGREPEDVDWENCTEPDPANCQNFFTCLGVRMRCPLDRRYDAAAGACRHYYLTDCGSRFNPQFPHNDAQILCADGQTRYPMQSCRMFGECTPNQIVTATCLPGLFDIPTLECADPSEVDCGSRTT